MTSTLDRRFRSIAGRLRVGALPALLACACSSGDPAAAIETIGRDLFIETYVDLRATALESEDRVLTDEARTEVLARHGVTEESLLTFTDVHGRDVELMSEVWAEVELRLDGMRTGDAIR